LTVPPQSYFGTALAPLTRLTHVMLVVITSIAGPGATYEGNDPLVVVGPGWTGECGECADEILARDTLFRAAWMEKKARAPRPPALVRVEWRFDVVHVKTDQRRDEDVIDLGSEDGEEDAVDDVDVAAESGDNNNLEAQGAEG
jgi:hypothetical protein